MYAAKVIADSISKTDRRIITMEVVMPRIILAEFNTHRMFSRNSASSRAIPFRLMLKSVVENPFTPIKWMKDHAGMQGTEYYSNDEYFEFPGISDDLFFNRFKYKDGDELDPALLAILQNIAKNFHGKRTLPEWWLYIRDRIVECATLLFCMNVSKQVCNRLLEPFMWHKVLVTSTNWENFFALRDDPAAEIHMQHIAHIMLDAANASTPVLVDGYDWHIPFGDQIQGPEFGTLLDELFPGAIAIDFPVLNEIKIKIATARCAQISYTVVGEEGKPMDFKKLIALHDRLSKSGHWSPFEHCAYPMNEGSLLWNHGKGYSGNFYGWRQYRKTFPNENRTDPRFAKKTYNGQHL